MENFNLHFEKSEMEYFKTKGVVEHLETKKIVLTRCYESSTTTVQKSIFKNKLDEVNEELKLAYMSFEHWKRICEEYNKSKFEELELLAEQNPRWGSNSWDL